MNKSFREYRFQPSWSLDFIQDRLRVFLPIWSCTFSCRKKSTLRAFAPAASILFKLSGPWCVTTLAFKRSGSSKTLISDLGSQSSLISQIIWSWKNETLSAMMSPISNRFLSSVVEVGGTINYCQRQIFFPMGGQLSQLQSLECSVHSAFSQTGPPMNSSNQYMKTIGLGSFFKVNCISASPSMFIFSK